MEKRVVITSEEAGALSALVTSIRERLDSVEDATLAKRLLSQGHGEVAIPETGRTLNAGERRAPE